MPDKQREIEILKDNPYIARNVENLRGFLNTQISYIKFAQEDSV